MAGIGSHHTQHQPIREPAMLISQICRSGRVSSFVFLLSVVFFIAFSTPSAAAPNASLAALAERYNDARARFDPVRFGTEVGDHRFDDQLPIDIAPQQRRERFAAYRQFQRQLNLIDRARLDNTDALTYDQLAFELRTQLAFEAFDDHLLPLHQMGSIPRRLARFGNGQSEQPLDTVAQYEAYLKRIERLPAWSEQAIANMREGLRRGIVQPKVVTEATLAQLVPLGSSVLADNPFYAPIRNLPAGFVDRDRQRLERSYRAAVEQRVAPAMRRLARFFESQYLPACRDSATWAALPNGAEWYRLWMRESTTSELEPQQIHALGLKEVARVHDELAKLAPRLGYEGDPRKLLAWMRAQPQYRPFQSAAQVLDAYQTLNAQLEPKLPQVVGRAPKAALDIRLVASASRLYTPPAEDGSRPGVFSAIVTDPATFDAADMALRLLHDGRPGHHYQLALAQELPLPAFRKRVPITAFGEGWAVYTESLGFELNLYDDPAYHAGFLRNEMLRAVRLVADTGIHANGWSRDQAVAYLMENTGLAEAQAKSEVHRYMAKPGEALSYKLAALRFQALRERAERRLGGKFSLPAFHDALLAEGALPLLLLDRRIDHWIDEQL
jgi:uncharacterized protein (DUF885 family)